MLPAAAPRAAFLASLRALLALALPIAGVSVGMMLMGVVETLIVGHVSPVALAAVALGHLYFFVVLVFGTGVLSTLDPLIAQGLGANDQSQVTLAVQRGVLISLALSAAAVLFYLPAGAVLRWLGQPIEVVPAAEAFVHASIAGAPPFLLYFVFGRSLNAMQRPRAVVVTVVAANVVNALLCAALTLGWYGMPRLGVVGAAWSGTLSRWFMAGTLLWLGRHELVPRLKPFRSESTDLRALWRMFSLGAPLGATAMLEFGIFATIALMVGRFGTVAVAGHQVAINITSFTFMVPMGISGATSVLVGQAVGRDDLPAARRAAGAGLALGTCCMLATSALYVLMPRQLSGLYTPDLGVLAMAASLLPISGVFQLFDGAQVVCVGALRGLGDTRAPMWINMIGFWVFGMPISLLLGFRLGLGPVGLWWGFVGGLGAVAVLLMLRLRSRLERGVVRVRVDEQA